MRSLRIHPSAIPTWLEPALAESPRPTTPPPLISRRQHARLAPRLDELRGLLDAMLPLTREALPPELQRRAHNAVTLADRVLATLPIDPPPPLEGISNADYGVAMLVRLIGVSRFIAAAGKSATRANIEAASGPYKIYPRASGEA